jgi:hypothetical protein
MAINLMAPQGDKKTVELAERVLASLQNKGTENTHNLGIQKQPETHKVYGTGTRESVTTKECG